jgi:Flp pilus assembly protein TadG
MHKLFRAIGRFVNHQDGNIAVIFTLALVPVIGFLGAGIDYSRVNRARTGMQDALDSAALMVAKDAGANNLTAAQISQEAQTFFTAMFNHPEVANITITASYNSGSNPSLVVTGSGTVETNFMKLVGTPSMGFTLSSTISWGQSRLRVALVLDNTGSMNDNGKIGALKTATASLLAQFKAAANTDGDVYVSIIPFVKDVNLGASNNAASWIDWGDWDASNGTCSGAGHGYSGRSSSSCSGTWTPSTHTSWNGCVVDRGGTGAPDTGNYDTNVVVPTASNTATLYSAEQYSACPQAALGLSYDWTGMNTLVNNMVANGNTNQALGLQLGWLSLVGGGPFTAPAMASGYSYQQVIIILTDGLNTEDRWYSNQSSIDARQQLTCNNIKAAGITLFTIQVDTGGDPTSTLLQNCASDSSKFFLLTAASQILPTFNAITASISKLRIAN